MSCKNSNRENASTNNNNSYEWQNTLQKKFNLKTLGVFINKNKQQRNSFL